MRTLTIRTLFAALAAAMVLIPSSALGQEARSAVDPRPRRLSISLQGGVVSGGRSASFEQYMREIGYDFTRPGQCFFDLCGGPTSHPHSKTAFSTMLAFKYRFWDKIAAQFIYATGGSGETTGSAGFFDELILRHHVTTVATLATVEGGPAHLGLGPALYSTKVDGPLPGSGQGETKLGLLAEAGFEIPWSSRIFVDLRLQYRFVGSAAIGPFEGVDMSNATEPVSPVDFSHGYVGVGFGIRF